MAFDPGNLVLVNGQYDQTAIRAFSYRNSDGDDLTSADFIANVSAFGLRLGDLVFTDEEFAFRVTEISNGNATLAPYALASSIAIVPDFWTAADPDDTLSLLRAMGASKLLFFPARASPYILDPTVTYRSRNLQNLTSSTIIKGDGPGRTILKWKAGLSNNPLFWFKTNTLSAIFSDLTIDSNYQNQSDDGGFTQNAIRFTPPSPSGESSLFLNNVEFTNGRRVSLWIGEPPSNGRVSVNLFNVSDREGLKAATSSEACIGIHVSGRGVDLRVRDLECTLSRDCTLLNPTTPSDYGRAGLVVQNESGFTNTYRSRVSVIGAYGRNIGHGVLNTLGLVDCYSGPDLVEITDVVGDNVFGRMVSVKADAAAVRLSNLIARNTCGDNATAVAMFLAPNGDAQYSYQIQGVLVDTVSGTGSYGLFVDGASSGNVVPFYNDLEVIDIQVLNSQGAGAILLRNLKNVRLKAYVRNAANGVTFSGLQESFELYSSFFKDISNSGVSGITFVYNNDNLKFIGRNNTFAAITQNCYSLPKVKSITIDGDAIDTAATFLRYNGTDLLSRVTNVTGRGVTTPRFLASGSNLVGLTWENNDFDTANLFSFYSLTIASDTIFPTLSFHYILGEGSADDNITYIGQGLFDGQILTLVQGSSGHKISFTPDGGAPPAGTAPIRSGNQIQFYGVRDTITLVYVKAAVAWNVSSVRLNQLTYGVTGARPTLSSISVGYAYFDTTLGTPIWWNGTAWVNSAGVVV